MNLRRGNSINYCSLHKWSFSFNLSSIFHSSLFPLHMLSAFLDAFSHFFKRVFSSIHRSVGPFVRPSVHLARVDIVKLCFFYQIKYRSIEKQRILPWSKQHGCSVFADTVLRLVQVQSQERIYSPNSVWLVLFNSFSVLAHFSTDSKEQIYQGGRSC